MNSAHELATLVEALQRLRADGKRAALATLTRTFGSTFRRAGTHMLVHENGEVVCELSGGCPQRDIVLRAQHAIAANEPALISYNAESGLDVMMEMGCGGELEVLVTPLDPSGSSGFVEALAGCIHAQKRACLATVFRVDGNVTPPRHVLWTTSAGLLDELGDPALSSAIRNVARFDHGRAATLTLPSSRGEADVLIEPIVPSLALVIIGSSATTRALLPLASALGWRVTVVDNDPQRLQSADLPASVMTVCAEPAQLVDALSLDARTSVVVMTHNLERDIAYLAALREAPLAYLGALGSQERARSMREHPALADARLYAPAGLDIGSETPTEIALSVLAEIMAVVNDRSGVPLREINGTIHG